MDQAANSQLTVSQLSSQRNGCTASVSADHQPEQISSDSFAAERDSLAAASTSSTLGIIHLIEHGQPDKISEELPTWQGFQCPTLTLIL